MTVHAHRLQLLRKELQRCGLDGFIVPTTDEYLSEYVGGYAKRLGWLTGFDGSMGSAVVLADAAAIFVDGRYTLQARGQVDGRYWECQAMPQSSVTDWLAAHASQGARIGYDSWLHTKGWVVATRAALLEQEAELVAVETNPVDAVWHDRPKPSAAKLDVHPEEFAGKSSSAKRRDIAEWLVNRKLDAVVLSKLDSIAWVFNVRGGDVDHTPVAMAYALVHADGAADLFVVPEKLTDQVLDHLGGNVRTHASGSFSSYLGSLVDKRIAVDAERSVVAIFDALEAAGARIVEARDPAVLPKAIKNSTEIAGHKAAQARDGAALCRFLHWLSLEGPKGTLTELSAAQRLREFREAAGKFRDLSFATISGVGSNGAIVHYRTTAQTNRPIAPDTLYLIDSGGQYLDGTTDVTRTIAIGTPSSEMRDRFTRVLRGHIALARAIFPAGTWGSQLDVLARQYLWAAGLDYAHGTGHGVGAYLAVHEGPQRIAHTLDSNEPLAPGMILSNEPAYYKEGEYGIRIESLVLVVERAIPGAERPMLGFEILTFAPIDRALIELAVLSTEDRVWVDAYHADVARIIGPQLEGAGREWLMDATRPLGPTDPDERRTLLTL